MFNSIWYLNLIKPPLTPPNWVFGPVWSLLYVSLLISFIIFAKNNIQNKKTGYVYFAIQLLLNIIWTPVFFGMKNIPAGLVIIILLDIFVSLTIFEFLKISKVSGMILIPYFVWILFATYLNIGYLILN